MTFRSPMDIFSQDSKGTLGGKISPAVVTDNNDPEKLQRVKFRISGLHTNRTDDGLSWAMPFALSPQGHAPNGVGSIAIPVIGAKIGIFFPEDDEHQAYYMCDYSDSTTKNAELLEDYPFSYGHVDSGGNMYLVNTQANTARFVHVTGSYIKFNADGTGEVGFASTLYIKSEGDVNIDGTTINLNCGATSGHVTITPRTRPPTLNFSNQTDY